MISNPYPAIARSPAISSRGWFREHLFTHEDTGGRPYDESAYPHITAPGGPADALDDKRVQNIWLQWGSRLGKSFFSQCATLFYAENQPCPMMIAGPDEKITKEVVLRTYGMMRNSRCLRKHLKPERRRRQDRIDFQRCRMYAAWSRSVSTLADKAVRFGHGNEIDKWEHESTSKEADPLKLFTDRGKEFPTRKFVLESTPTIKGRSRIENGRLQSTNCKLHVPCPHCAKYQALTMDRLKWEKLETGKHDKDQARKTARYECEHCEKAILDEHRSQMMRRGVWVPEGCKVNHEAALAMFTGDRKPWRGWSLAEWIEGEPSRNGNDAGYQLSSLYALALGWGDIAAEFVACKEKPQNLRNFINQWLAETWEIHQQSQSWEQLGKRLICDVPHGQVPMECSLLTCGMDRQKDHVVYVVEAWGPNRRSHTVTYGEMDSAERVRDEILRATFIHQDGGVPLRIEFTLIDSGHQTSGIYEFCSHCVQNSLQVWPCKGASHALGAPYRQAVLGQDTLFPGAPLVHVDTITTQDWIETQLYKLNQGDEGHATLFNADVWQHQDFLEQMLNETQVFELDSKNYGREVWRRINENVPNDFRDARRYAYVAMLMATRGSPIRSRTAPAEKPRPMVTGGQRRPDGRPWL